MKPTESTLPTGTVTFLFTDIEGSTRLAMEHGDNWEAIRQRHHTLLRTAVESNDGQLFELIGDASSSAFQTARQALVAAVEAQRSLAREAWPGAPVQVRMAIHTGDAQAQDQGYTGYLTLTLVQRLMSLAYGGQILLSNATAQLLGAQAPESIGLRDLGNHQLRNLPKPEHVWQAVVPDLRQDFPPLAASSAPKDNLPVLLTSFVGREEEVSQVTGLIQSRRLVTLTGAGGSGKTRLALKVAEGVRTEYDDGVWLVEFASLSDANLVPQAVASVLRVREQSGESVTNTLADHLATRHLLLILDNCEHLVGACAGLVNSLLMASPKLAILATSREPLGVPGEILWNLAPMSLPESRPGGGPRDIEQQLEAYARSEAVQLFVQRAAEATSDFRLTAGNAAAVANLCRRLDGLPLAIELAAARARALSVAEISERLDSRFRLLTGGGRTAPARQQTLEATLDWSHALLTDSEAKVLRRLSIFAGGGTLKAAEAVLGRGEIESEDVLDLILRLADRSMLTMNKARPQSTRWRMLQVIREYAQRKLEEAGESDAYRGHHLDYFREWAEDGDTHVRGPQQVEWLDLFEADHDNLRAALEWSLAAPDRAQAAMELAASCSEFWRIRGHFVEAETQLKAALGQGESGGRTKARAAALTHLAHIDYLQTRYPEMRPVAEEALSIWRELGQDGRAGLARILDLLGELASEEGHYDASYQYFQDSLDIYRELNDGLGIGEMLMQIGWATMRTGDYVRAEEYLLECLERMREVGTVRNLTFALSGCGEVALRQGRYQDARRRLQEALDLARQSGDKWLIGTLLGSLGWAALLEGDFGQMQQRLGESLSVRMAIGDKGGTAWCLEKLAEAALALHQPAAAVRGFAAASALRAPMGSVIDPADLPDYERIQGKLKTHLGEDKYAEAWKSGELAPVEGIIGELLALESPSQK